MVKSEIIETLAERMVSQAYKIPRREVRAITRTCVDAIFNAMSAALSNGQRIEIRGFGCFSLRKRAAGLVRNPRSNISLNSDERYNVYFRAGKNLAIAVNRINWLFIATPIQTTKTKLRKAT